MWMSDKGGEGGGDGGNNSTKSNDNWRLPTLVEGLLLSGKEMWPLAVLLLDTCGSHDTHQHWYHVPAMMWSLIAEKDIFIYCLHTRLYLLLFPIQSSNLTFNSTSLWQQPGLKVSLSHLSVRPWFLNLFLRNTIQTLKNI